VKLTFHGEYTITSPREWVVKIAPIIKVDVIPSLLSLFFYGVTPPLPSPPICRSVCS
jgi:hypothetical protein